MTREEVIARLKEIDIRDALQEDYDALYVAIEALEQQPCEYYDADNKTCRRSEVPKEPCEDIISRQAVLEFIRKQIDHSLWAYNKLVNGIKDLPPVTPQPKTNILDKIRAEIRNIEYLSCPQPNVVLNDVLQIINKYRAESEG